MSGVLKGFKPPTFGM